MGRKEGEGRGREGKRGGGREGGRLMQTQTYLLVVGV